MQEAAMMRVALHTHWVPLYWRARAHTREVRAEFQALFPLQVRTCLFNGCLTLS